MTAFGSLLDEIDAQLSEILRGMSLDLKYSIVPGRDGLGDASSNAAFLAAKVTGGKPAEIAADIAKRFRPTPLVRSAVPHESGYLNFLADGARLSETVIRDALAEKYGGIDLGRGATTIVEHTSVNPNKALHIGHVRNMVIGDCIARILEKAGFCVRVLNYIDDSGLQVADIVLGLSRLGHSTEPPEGTKFDRYCGDTIYADVTRRHKEDPGLNAERRNVLAEMEDEGSESARLAHRITSRVLECQLETCWDMGARYDCLNFESQILRSGLWKEAFEELKKTGIIEYEESGENAGCWVVRARDGDKVIVRSNGTATYIAKDIPYAAWKLGLAKDPFRYVRYEPRQPGRKTLWQTTLDEGENMEFAASRVITVIDSRQARLQEIIARIMTEFKSDPGAYVHLKYESVTLSAETARALGADLGGRQVQMSGRSGIYAGADEVLAAIKGRARKETISRNPGATAEEADSISGSIASATLRYEMARQDLDKTITFDLDRSLSLEGDTAAYIQYAFARAGRILEKAGETDPSVPSYGALDSEYERRLIRIVGMYETCVRDAALNLSPKVVARYCRDMAFAFSGFYEHVKVLDSEGGAREARLLMIRAFRKTLRDALGLLGIKAPERM